MRLIPVVDIRHGVAVRAVGGRRAEYRPVTSRLTTATDPVAVAEAMLRVARSDEVYVADLDAILEERPQMEIITRIRKLGVRVLADVGVRTVDDVRRVREAGLVPVLGTETIGWDTLEQCRGDVLSVDLFGGKLTPGWGDDPLGLVVIAECLGFREMILLDVARVGENAGPGTAELCRQVKAWYPHVRLIAGGGVRDRADAEALGADAVLVASALHDGRLP